MIRPDTPAGGSRDSGIFKRGGELSMQMLNDLIVTIVWVPIAVVMLKAAASVIMPSGRGQRAS